MKHRAHSCRNIHCARVAILMAVAAGVNPRAVHAADKPPAPAAPPPIVYQITEKAFDGSHSITTESRLVDANSDISVRFDKLVDASLAAPSPEWTRLNQVLEQLNQTYAQIVELRSELKTLDRADATVVAKLKTANAAFSARADANRTQVQHALGLDGNDEAFDRIASGRFDGKGNALQYYANLARWVRGELDRLNKQTSDFANARKVFVTVQAFHSSLGGTRQAVHVEGFDNIPAGELQPIDRTGLRMTEAEQKQLSMQIKMSEQAVATIKEITKSSGEVKGQVQTLVTQFKAHLAKIEQDLDKKPSAWAANLVDPAFTQPLETIAQNTALPEAQRNGANVVLHNLQAFKQDYDTVNSLILQIQITRNSLTEAQSLTQLLTAATDLPPKITTLANALRAFEKNVESWPKRLDAIASGLGAIATNLTPQQRSALVPSELTQFGEALKADFPITIEFAQQIISLFKDQGLDVAADTLAGVDGSSIWRDKSNLVPGNIELTRAGIAQGDEIMVRVGYRQGDANGAPGSVITTETYKLETELMGFHRKYGAAAVFARGSGNTPAERSWKPTVSANVHWFYRRRDPSGAWKLWNAINPGIGIHVATLNQGTDAVEFGVGPSISLFDGILTGGIGRNLNNQQHTYYEFGLSLFDTLEHVKRLGIGSPR